MLSSSWYLLLNYKVDYFLLVPCERRCTKTHIPFRGLLASQLVCKECDTKVICNGKSCCGVISTKVCLRFQCHDSDTVWITFADEWLALLPVISH